MAFNLLPAHAGHRSHVARRNACCHFVYFSNEFEDDEHSEANVDAGKWDWHWQPHCGCPPAPWHVSCLCKLLTLARQQATGELRPADWKASSPTQLASGGAASPSPHPWYLSLSLFTGNWFCLFIVKNCLLLFVFVLPLWLTSKQFEATLSYAWNWFYFTYCIILSFSLVPSLPPSLFYFLIMLSWVFTSETATFLVSSLGANCTQEGCVREAREYRYTNGLKFLSFCQ